MSEKDVFIQNVSDEEMEAVAGGKGEKNLTCVSQLYRDIYNPSFPNCAATVEKDSFCLTNDACYIDAIQYKGMRECGLAWE